MTADTYAHTQLNTLVYKEQARSERALLDYYAGGFDGGYFDSYDGNASDAHRPYDITATDFMAVSLLGMGRVMPRIARAFAANPKLYDDTHDLLKEIPIDVALHEAPQTMIGPSSAAYELWNLIRNINGGHNGITATKILARKRPHLLPMADTEVRAHLGLEPTDSAWDILWSWFQDPDHVAASQALVHRVEHIRPLARSGAGSLSLLRAVDVPMWMIQKGNA